MADVAEQPRGPSAEDGSGGDGVQETEVPQRWQPGTGQEAAPTSPTGIAGTAPGAPYTVVEGCAVLAPYDPKTGSTACQAKGCSAGTLCMGRGFCLPVGKWKLAEDALNLTSPALAIRSDDEWGLVYTANIKESSTEVLDSRIHLRVFHGADVSKPDFVDVTGLGLGWFPTLLPIEDGAWIVGWLARGKGFNNRHHLRVVHQDGSMGAVVRLEEKETFLGLSNQYGVKFGRLGGRSALMAVWSLGGQGSQPGDARVVARMLASSGELGGGMIPLSAVGNHAWSPEFAPLAEGGVVLWSGAEESGGLKLTPLRVHGRRLDRDGQPLGPPFRLPDMGQTLMYEGSVGVTAFHDDSLLVSKTVCASKLLPCNHTRYSFVLNDPLATTPLGGAELALGLIPSYIAILPTRHAIINGHRAVMAWSPYAYAYGAYTPLASYWLRRYYRPENVYDCSPEPIPGSGEASENPGANGYFAIAAFPDGRLLAVWRETNTSPKNTSRLMLRFFPR